MRSSFIRSGSNLASYRFNRSPAVLLGIVLPSFPMLAIRKPATNLVTLAGGPKGSLSGSASAVTTQTRQEAGLMLYIVEQSTDSATLPVTS
jgi:hypothetical protein